MVHENTATHYTHDFFLPAAPEVVFAACTDPHQLRTWFAHQAEIADPKPGAPFRFWGRATPDTPTEAEADQKLMEWAPGERVVFTWTWAGIPTTVQWSFKEGEMPAYDCDPTADEDATLTGTLLTVRHTLDRPLPYPRPEQVVDDFWRLATANLLGHLDGRGNVVLPDFDDPEPVVRISIEVDAPPPAVFEALTTPGILNRWLAKHATVELREGGAFDLGWGPVPEHVTPMHILRLEQDRLLSFSWPDWRQQKDVPDQSVTFELAPIDDGERTRVNFTHAGFVRTVDRSDYQQGWTVFMDALVKVFPAANDA